MSELTIGAVHFDNSMPPRLQKTRQTRSIRSGALNAKGMDRTERSRPGFEIPVAFGEYGDCQCPKTGPDPVDRDSGVAPMMILTELVLFMSGSPEVRT